MNRNGWIGVVVLVLVIVGSLRALAPARADQDATGKLMRLKLTHAQGILEGIAVADFPRIEREARSLSAITQQAAWKAIEDPRYLDYSIRMRNALDAMAQQAAAKNLDGAAFNYVQVTMTCVDCHKFIRDAKKVDAGPAPAASELAAR